MDFKYLLSALALCTILGGCGTASYRGTIASKLSAEQATDVTLYAVGLVGTPYRHGGNTPDSGFDCSGLIGHVYKTRADLVPPRTVATLNNWGQSVPGDYIRSGDLVFFAQSDVPTHAGIYVGNGRFVHAPSTGGEVRLDYLNSKYWAARQVSFRRP
jgi:cell wall-associated NlpC family hydrolase